MKSHSTKKIIKEVLKKKWYLIIILIIIICIVSYLRLINSLLISEIIDNVIPNKDINYLKRIIILMIIFAFSLLGFDLLRTLISASVGNSITATLRKVSFSHMLNAKYSEVSKFESSQLMTRITRETGKVGEVYIVGDVINFLSEIIFLIVVLLTMIKINIIFTLVVFSLFPVFYLLTKFVSKVSKKQNKEYLEMLEEGQTIITNACQKIKKIKIQNGVKKEQMIFHQWMDKLYKHLRKEKITHSLNRFFMGDLIMNIMYIVILIIGINFVISEKGITTGTLVAFLTIVPKIYNSFRILLNINVSSKIITNSTDKLDEIFNLELESEVPNNKIVDIKHLTYSNVSYSYGENMFSINDINFSVNKGEKLGIIGLSGGGKSTLFDLIVKLMDVQNGEILINDKNINKYNLNDLRNTIAYVQQEQRLFPRSIRENIIYPLEYDEKKYSECVEKSELKKLINKLPKGDQTVISYTDDNLSGGEIQRINLANGLYRDAQIYLFDEITSALDVETEKKIMSYIDSLNDKIILIISHRIYTILNCDKILILNDGKIVEYGYCNDLLKNEKSILNSLININK